MRRDLPALALAAALLVGCDAREAPLRAIEDRRDTAQPGITAVDTIPSHGLKLFRGDGFQLSIPMEAIVAQRHDTTWISAPKQTVSARVGTADTMRFENDIPLYGLEIRVRSKPARQPLAAWGDSVVKAANVDADEYSRETGELVFAAGQPAFLREPACGDCGIYIYCFARDSQVVEVSWVVSTNEPMGMRKRGVYALLLSTFRWIPEAGR